MEDEGPQRERYSEVWATVIGTVLVILIVAMTCLGLEGKAPWQ